MGGLGHGHGHQHENITIDWDRCLPIPYLSSRPEILVESWTRTVDTLTLFSSNIVHLLCTNIYSGKITHSSSIKWDELTPEEKWNYEHLKMHQKHAGHAEMHAEMILILLVVLVVSQVDNFSSAADSLLTSRLFLYSGRSEDHLLTIFVLW